MRRRHRFIFEQRERRIEQRMQFLRGNTEGRAPLVIIEEEETYEPSARAHQFRDAHAPARPVALWQRAEKRALIDEFERRAIDRRVGKAAARHEHTPARSS